MELLVFRIISKYWELFVLSSILPILCKSFETKNSFDESQMTVEEWRGVEGLQKI